MGHTHRKERVDDVVDDGRAKAVSPPGSTTACDLPVVVQLMRTLVQR